MKQKHTKKATQFLKKLNDPNINALILDSKEIKEELIAEVLARFFDFPNYISCLKLMIHGTFGVNISEPLIQLLHHPSHRILHLDLSYNSFSTDCCDQIAKALSDRHSRIVYLNVAETERILISLLSNHSQQGHLRYLCMTSSVFFHRYSILLEKTKTNKSGFSIVLQDTKDSIENLSIFNDSNYLPWDMGQEGHPFYVENTRYAIITVLALMKKTPIKLLPLELLCEIFKSVAHENDIINYNLINESSSRPLVMGKSRSTCVIS